MSSYISSQKNAKIHPNENHWSPTYLMKKVGYNMTHTTISPNATLPKSKEFSPLGSYHGKSFSYPLSSREQREKGCMIIFCGEERDMKDWEASFLKFIGTYNKGRHIMNGAQC
jgi:ubiquitin-protein ligase